MLDIIMYHYVRNNEEHDFDCFARRWSEFEDQINFLAQRIDIVSPADSEKIRYYLSHPDSASRGCLLTFDDGYKEHLDCAKFLKSKNLSAFFFPSTSAIRGDFLDVNSIHMLVGARGVDIEGVLSVIVSEIKRQNLSILSFDGNPISLDGYLAQHIASSYDDRETILVKRLLQRDIVDLNSRKGLILHCLDLFFRLDRLAICDGYYLSIDDMREMRSDGMFFGSHCFSHNWLAGVSRDQQSYEITESFAELERLSLYSPITDPRVVCYPYGSYDEVTLSVMAEQSVDYGLSTKEGPAFLGPDVGSAYRLSRWDTNSFWDNKWRKPVIPLC